MSRLNVRFALCLVLICSAVAVVPASAQYFRLMKGSLTQIAAGRNEVWGLNGSQPYRFNSGSLGFVKISDKASGPLSQIAVGGGSLLEPDQVWAISATGLVYQYDFSTKAFVYVTGGIECKFCLYTYFSQLAVGEGDVDRDNDGCHPYEVWALQSNAAFQGLPYRYNYCEGQFDQIPLPGSTPLTVMATGGADIWALDANAHIYHYNQFRPGWSQITNGGFSGTLQHIAIGVNDVWGLDGNGTLYRYDPNTATFVSMISGNPITGVVTQISVGGDGVWGIDISDDGLLPSLLRFDSGPQGFLFMGFPTGNPPAQIAAGSGAGVWGLDTSNNVYAWVRP